MRSLCKQVEGRCGSVRVDGFGADGTFSAHLIDETLKTGSRSGLEGVGDEDAAYSPQHDRFKMQKIEQLVRLVKESHEQPMTGESRLPEMVKQGRDGSYVPGALFFSAAGGWEEHSGGSGVFDAADCAAAAATAGCDGARPATD